MSVLQHDKWPIEKLVEYVRNPRKNDAVVDRMCGQFGSLDFGFPYPVQPSKNPNQTINPSH